MITYPTKSNNIKELRLGANSKYLLDGGLCLDQESSIDISQSPYLLNMTLDDGGLPKSRLGQANLFPTSLGTDKINGVYPDYKGYTIFACGTKLYKQQSGNQPIEIYSSLTNSKAFFFVFNGLLYMLNGSQYLKYDGSTVSDVVPYIPTVSLNRKPDASESTVNESWNLIGRGFTDSFNGDGSTKTYKLSFAGLDSDTVISNVGGTEGSGFTVDRTTGEVTFTTASGTGNNNVKITAYKTFADNKEQILNCTRAIESYGRIFITGNSNIPNAYWVMGISDSNDCSYFPTKYIYKLTKSNKPVTGFTIHFGKLIVFTEDMTCTVDNSTFDNQASFPINYLNTEVGCDMPDSIQLIDNNPVWCNTYSGVKILVSSLIEGEKNVKDLSFNVNGDYERPGLLAEAGLKQAVSFDSDGKYGIVLPSGIAYVWDYERGYSLNNPKSMKWFKWDNIKASCFFTRDNTLMYGHSERGQLCKFINALNDFGQSINRVFRLKLLDFGYPDWEKAITDTILVTRPSNSSIKVKYYNKDDVVMEQTISQSTTNSFKWSTFKWSTFTWKVQRLAVTIRIKLKLKKLRYLDLEFSNDEFNQDLSIIGLTIKYSMVREVR
jgi:hypothetical protein